MRGVSDEGLPAAPSSNHQSYSSGFSRRPSFTDSTGLGEAVENFDYDDDDDELEDDDGISYDNYDKDTKSIYGIGDDKSIVYGDEKSQRSMMYGDEKSMYGDEKSMYGDEKSIYGGGGGGVDDEKSVYTTRSARSKATTAYSSAQLPHPPAPPPPPATSTKPTLLKTHEGEHLADFGSLDIPLSRNVTIYAVCAALNSCNLGYDIGANSAAKDFLQESMDLNPVQIQVFLGSLNLFAMTGALSAHMIADNYGRRGAFMISALVFIVGVVIMAISNNFVSLMFGRVFVGLGVGFGFAVDPMYIAEIAPAAHRGRLVTWSEIGVNVGIIFGFIAGLMFGHINPDTAWRCMFGMGIILPCIMMILLWAVMPETPRWLVQQGRDMDAAIVLQKIYGMDYDVVSLVNSMKMSILKEEEIERAEGWYLMLFPTTAFRRMVIVGLGTAVAQQVVGMDAIQNFMISMLKDDSGIHSSAGQKWILIVLGCFRLIFIVLGGRYFDQKGRKPLIFISLAGCSVALLFLSFNFYGSRHSTVFAIICCAMYFSFYSVGIGPGGWLIPSEVFPTSIRSKAMSLGTFLNRATATLVLTTYESVAQSLSWSGFFLFLSFMCGVVALFMAAVLPETKGRSLEDMVVYFAEITGDRSILQVELAHQGEGLLQPDNSAYENPNGDDNKQVPASGMMA